MLHFNCLRILLSRKCFFFATTNFGTTATVNSRGRNFVLLAEPTISCANFSSAPKDALVPPPTVADIAKIAEQIPIEKRSLSRGLSVNEFEKDFIIFPEYGHVKEHERIKEFVQRISDQLDQAYDQIQLQNGALTSTAAAGDGVLPAQIQRVIEDNKLFAVTVPKEFGGVDFCQKDMLHLSERLGSRDLSLFQTFNNTAMAAHLLLQFGTDQQKDRYLPGIGTGEWRIAVCIRDETSGTKPVHNIHASKGQQEFLNATKVDVENARDANLFVVFANRHVGDIIVPTCFLIERATFAESANITVRDQIRTGGLQHCNFSTVVFENVPVNNSIVLGSRDNAGYLSDEISLVGKTAYGAAVVGFLKKILGDLCHFSNQQVKGNLRLSDSHPIQRALTELGLLTYVLESIVYYIGGLIDEQLFLLQDIENAIIQRFCNRAIRQSIKSITEVAGLGATNTELGYEQMLRDAIALMSLSEPDLHLVRRITIPSIETYVNKFGGLGSFNKTFSAQKMLNSLTNEIGFDFMNPEIVHYIAEHVHPSLQPAAHSLEHTMSRLGLLIDKVTTDKGIYTNTDYPALESIALVMENMLGMTATMARASRSYAIGLKGADFEIDWTATYCNVASEQCKNIMIDIIKFQGLVRTNPRMTEIGNIMLQCNGYFPEDPLEKNW